jgi:hypothetical protein
MLVEIREELGVRIPAFKVTCGERRILAIMSA